MWLINKTFYLVSLKYVGNKMLNVFLYCDFISKHSSSPVFSSAVFYPVKFLGNDVSIVHPQIKILPAFTHVV